MPKYECTNCRKVFSHKGHYTRHIKRKFPCKNSQLVNIGCEETPVIAGLCPDTKSEDLPNTIPSVIEGNKPECKYCGKKFEKKYNMTRHIEICKIKNDNEDEKMEELMKTLIEMKDLLKARGKEIDKLKEGSNFQQFINTQNNYNIKIVAYGKENIDRITVKDFKRILNRGMNSVPELVKKIHFDKNLPENHNVYISNLRDSYVLMYDGNTWRLANRDEALQQLFEDKSGILETKFEELIDGLNELTIEKFQNFLDATKDTNQYVQGIKNDLKKILYENRQIIAQTRKHSV
jgi:peptide methionine sulfoxide reductase MsrA